MRADARSGADGPRGADEPGGVQRLEQLLERARRVLPQDWPYGAVWAVHHAEGVYPQFAERADGARFRDVAGREYLDWFLGGGVVTLGHRHPAVQRAMAEQLERGVHLSLSSGLEVDVAERICALLPGAEQVVFGKNGTDVTSAAVRLARSITGREQVLISGYHGWQDWSRAAIGGCVGVPASLRELVHEFGFNDLESARELMERHGRDVAAIVVEPMRYANLRADFLPGLRALADACGCLLVFDEIVTGFRVARGGMQQLSGVRADLVCLAKSLANGLPLAALAGPRRFMQHVPPIFFALTYQREALSLAAAKAALDVQREQDVPAHLARIGERLRAGFSAAAAAAGLDWSLDGHPSMLHLRLSGGGRLETAGAEALFVESCQRAGIYVQMHRLLPCLAHTFADVDATVAVMARAMEVVKQAMDHGLEGRLDSPIWSQHQSPGPATAEPVEERCEAAAADGRRVLRVESSDARRSRRCVVELPELATPPFSARARYRILHGATGNSSCSIVLAGCGSPDGSWFDVRHTTSLGQPAWSSASLGGGFVRARCPYGAREGGLELRFRRDAVTALHEAETCVIVGTGRPASQPIRLRFQLELTGSSEPVEVELVDFTIRAGDGSS